MNFDFLAHETCWWPECTKRAIHSDACFVHLNHRTLHKLKRIAVSLDDCKKLAVSLYTPLLVDRRLMVIL